MRSRAGAGGGSVRWATRARPHAHGRDNHELLAAAMPLFDGLCEELRRRRRPD